MWMKNFGLNARKIGQNLSRIIECDKPQGTIYKGPQGNLTVTVEVKRSFVVFWQFLWKLQDHFSNN